MAAIVIARAIGTRPDSYNSLPLVGPRSPVPVQAEPMLGIHDAAASLIAAMGLAAMLLAALVIKRRGVPRAARIDALLPQTQCTQCGYSGCRPYAEAIAAGEAQINRCPPGGEQVMHALARATGRPPLPLDPTCGVHKPRHLARIVEARCIGCTLCIQACPVDAIVGAPKLMHTVIAAECTGCELCLPPCPVDCIDLVPAPWSRVDVLLGRRARAAQESRDRYVARTARLARAKREQTERLAAKAAAKLAATAPTADPEAQRKRAIVEAALERARTRLAAGATPQART